VKLDKRDFQAGRESELSLTRWIK